jgi:hypothetical protein
LNTAAQINAKKFILFVNDIVQTRNLQALISCIGRRLTQPNIPMKPGRIYGRHTTKMVGTEIKMDDPLNGILRREYQKSNVLMEASSTSSGSVYDVLKADPNTDFYTSSRANSFITASLKDGKTFILKSYMIRGRKNAEGNRYQLRNWKLEGQKATNGDWIILDHHSNEPFDILLVKTFNVSCPEELKAVRLTQDGPDTNGSYYLLINAFDIFGILSD